MRRHHARPAPVEEGSDANDEDYEQIPELSSGSEGDSDIEITNEEVHFLACGCIIKAN